MEPPILDVQRRFRVKCQHQKRKPEPEPPNVQDSGLKKNVFGPSQFLTVSSKSFLKNMKKNKKVCNHRGVPDGGCYKQGYGQSVLDGFSPCFTLHGVQQDFIFDIHVRVGI